MQPLVILGPGGRGRRYLKGGTARLYRAIAGAPGGTAVGDIAIRDALSRTTSVYHGEVTLLLSTPTWLTRWRAQTFATKEPATLSWIENFPMGSLFWDVGANVGLYSLYAALARAARVVAFEPSAFNLEILVRNIYQNGSVDDIQVYPAALSDTEGFQKFQMMTTEWGGALSIFGGERAHETPRLPEVLRYRTWGTTLDGAASDLGFFPDFLKIDVDGIEPQILAGGKSVLDRVQSILIEVEPDNEVSVASVLGAAGLRRVPVDLTEDETMNQIWSR